MTEEMFLVKVLLEIVTLHRNEQKQQQYEAEQTATDWEVKKTGCTQYYYIID